MASRRQSTANLGKSVAKAQKTTTSGLSPSTGSTTGPRGAAAPPGRSSKSPGRMQSMRNLGRLVAGAQSRERGESGKGTGRNSVTGGKEN